MNLTKKVFQLVAFVSMFTLASCSTDIEPYEGGMPPSANPTVSSQFKVDFDGQTFVANQVVAIKQELPGAPVTTYSYTISGNLNNGTSSKAVTLQFIENPSNSYELTTDPPAGKGTGTVTYVEDVNNPSSYISTNPNQAFNSQGQINVSSNNNDTQTISGTFYANLYLIDDATAQVIGTKIFSNGVFTNVHYTVQ